MKRRFFLTLLLWGLGWAPARAVFVETQMDRIDHEPFFDEHYFVSILSFAYPLEWEDLWRSSAAPAYRIDAASLDCCELLLQQELRFRRELAKGFDFQFHMTQQDDKERQELHHWLEFEKRLFMGISASAFGEPTFNKGNSDIGLGLRFDRPRFRASLRHYLVDFDFNRRSGGNQRDARSPQTDEFSVEGELRAKDRLSVWLEIDHPLLRSVPDQNRVFSYRRTTLRLGWRRLEPKAWNPRIEYGYEFQAKGDAFNPDPAGRSISNRRQAHRFLAAAEGAWSAKDRLEAGDVLWVRAARSDFAGGPGSGVFYQRWETQPYARWRRELRHWLVSDLGTYLAFGDNRKRAAGGSALSDRRLAEAKLGAGLDFVFASGRVGLYTTWDLDKPAHPWGGGNARAMFFF